MRVWGDEDGERYPAVGLYEGYATLLQGSQAKGHGNLQGLTDHFHIHHLHHKLQAQLSQFLQPIFHSRGQHLQHRVAVQPDTVGVQELQHCQEGLSWHGA